MNIIDLALAKTELVHLNNKATDFDEKYTNVVNGKTCQCIM